MDRRGSIPILRTKLHRPPVGGDHVRRGRLDRLLDQGLDQALILVCAPAGYGKSLLVSQWVKSLDRASAWLSLDETDDQISVFLTYLIAAVRTVAEDACPKTLALLSTPVQPPSDVIVASLINELDSIASPVLLVLDDFHHLPSSSEAHYVLRTLLEHPPRSLRLVIITRHDPPLPLASMRGRGSLTEVRIQDLKFTGPETAEFLDKTSGLQASEAALANLVTQTEGWAAGLRLASIGLSDRSNANEYLEKIHGGSESVRQFLLSEAIRQLSPQMKDWLVKSSMLDRFCAKLCSAVCGADEEPDENGMEGHRFIRELQHRNLFTIALDPQGNWFRYHRLFRDLLLARLGTQCSPEETASLHHRASQWLESKGLIDEAIAHALKAQDTGRAAQIIEGNVRKVLDEGRWQILRKWLAKLPQSLINAQPELLLTQISIHYCCQEFAAIPPLLDRIDELLGDNAAKHRLSGEVASFRGLCMAYAGNTAQSLEAIEHALEAIPKNETWYRSNAEVFYGMNCQIQGGFKQAVEMTMGWLDDPQQQPLDPHRELSLLATLMFLFCVDADPGRAERLIKRSLALAGNNDLEEPKAWFHYIGGLSCLHQGAIPKAVALLEEAVDRRYFLHTRAAVDAQGALAIACQADGDDKRAAEELRSLENFIEHLSPAFSVHHDSIAARLAFTRGTKRAAQNWLRTAAPPGDELGMYLMDLPAVTWCRALIADKARSSLRDADLRLRGLARTYASWHNKIQLINIRILQALVLKEQQRADKALSVLAKAMELARPGNCLFPFMEHGVELDTLLARMAEQWPDDPLVTEIGAIRGNETAVPSQGGSDLAEPLTEREQEILQHVASRYSNKEIGKKLSISHETVKHHLKNIYQKLDVHSRREAALKARELRLIGTE